MDLLHLAASMPGILGYDPTGSVVLVALTDDPPSRLRFTVRVDTPATGEIRAVADQLATIMLRHEVVCVAVLGYAAAGGGEGLAPALAVVTDAVEAAGVCVVGAWTVDGGRAREHGECGDVWVALPESLVPGGEQPRAALAAGVEAGSGSAEVEAAAAGLSAPTARAVFEAWGRVLGLVDAEPEPVDFATAALGVRDVQVRDMVVAWACPGTLPHEALPRKVRRAALEALPEVPPWGAGEHRPGAEERVCGRLWALCQNLPDALVPEAGTVAASILWHAGDGARARMVLDRVQRVEPGHRLAAMLIQCLDHGLRMV